MPDTLTPLPSFVSPLVGISWIPVMGMPLSTLDMALISPTCMVNFCGTKTCSA